MPISTKFRATLLYATALGTLASPSSAQERIAADAPVDSSKSAVSPPLLIAADQQPEQVFVTARRREENAQDVPIGLTVVNIQQLETTGTYNFAQLTQLTPTVQFFSSNPRNTAITIRGLGTSFGLTNDGLEAGVGFYIDQVYMSRPAAATFDFIDVDQVEILRGPQGTSVRQEQPRPARSTSASSSPPLTTKSKPKCRQAITDSCKDQSIDFESYRRACAGGPAIGR